MKLLKNKKINFFKTFLALAIFSFSVFKIFEEVKRKNFLNFFYVGQGDSILINIGATQVLIDGGRDNTILHKISDYVPYFDKKIEFIIATHPDGDHIIGLIEILERYEVENIIVNGMITENLEWQEFSKNLKNSEVLYSNQVDYIDLGNNFLLKILSPKENLIGKKNSNKENFYSIISALFKGNKPIALFTGDAEIEPQENLENYDFEILKIAHHGSKKNTNLEILKKFTPESAIISAGEKNPYGHPAKEILEILENENIEIIELYKKNGFYVLL
ncbi:MAG: ComEC/Rec2 family competence protein [Patescibacteria group bacterium]